MNKDLGETGEEVEETGEDVEEIKEDVDDIKKEVEETGEDVEEIGEDVGEIKEDIEEIKEDIGTMRKAFLKGKSIVAKVIPEKFAFDDLAQQIVGATILSAPFAVTEEVWNLAKNLSSTNIIALIFLTILFDILLFYYTKYQKIEDKRIFMFPIRIASLIAVTYITSAVVLTVFGVIGGQIQDPVWAMKLIVMVGLFANIGAGTADLIK
ncbi:MAG: DUF2391 family protein [Nanoarchaeota archaeon]|nr:DUF2391 family protein [Nanoarchaeota archaeon]